MNESVFLLSCRIYLGKELNIPPDDIILDPIFECLKRSIVEGKSQINNEEIKIVIEPLNWEETRALSTPYGEYILKNIWDLEPPFFDYIASWAKDWVE